MRGKHVSSARGGASDPSGVASWILWYQRSAKEIRAERRHSRTFVEMTHSSTMSESRAHLTRCMVRLCARMSGYTFVVLISGQIDTSIRADPSRAHPDLDIAPRCRECKGSTRKQKVSFWNAIGNAGRPYYRCDDCDEFSCFGDMRGIHDANPRCHCPLRRRSRAFLTQRWDDKRGGRAVRYQCAVGDCEFDKVAGVYRRQGERLRVRDVVRAGL